MSDINYVSEQLLTRMERLGNIGHWRWNVRNDALFWSPGVYNIHGLDFAEYKPNLEAALDAYIPEDRNEVEEALSNAIENKEDFKFEKRIKRPDGEIRHIISQGECEVCPDTQELIAVYGVIQDITPIKQQEELYELAALGSSAALWDLDIAKDELRWAGRSAQVLGYALNEQLPQSTEEFYATLLHPDDNDLVKQALTNHFTKLDDFAVEIRIKRHDGSYQWFLSRAQAQFNDYGKAIRVCGSMTSIQDLKKAQTKLEQSNSDLENFASMAAHEIKAPIRTVASYLELMNLHKDELPEKLKPHIDKSIEISNQTSHMIDELLEYASLQDAQLRLSPFNLDKVTKLITRSMKKEIKASNAHMSLGNLPIIICDESKIKTVITNLIQNALKFKSDAPPEIAINVIEDDDYWQYSVKDNGIGMPKEDAEQVFEMFKRSNNARDIKGTGIGLSICSRIIDLHQGEIWAESKPDKGSTFHFTISKHLTKDA